MYNTNFIVKYHDIETELLEKIHNKTNDDYDECVEEYVYVCQDVIDICEKLYRDELLSVFNAVSIQDDKISQTLKQIFLIVVENDDFADTLTEIKSQISNQIISETPTEALNTLEIIFCAMFSHKMFHITHKCVCQILVSNTINHELLMNFKQYGIEMLKS